MKVLQTTEEILYENLKENALSMYEKERVNLQNCLVALIHQPDFRTKSKVTVCYPIRDKIFPIDETKFAFCSLPRIDTVSTIHYGDYDKLDEAFSALTDYITSKNLVTKTPVRIIFHKSEKFKGLFPRRTKDYVTEIQIELDKELA